MSAHASASAAGDPTAAKKGQMMDPIRIQIPKELFTPAECKHYEEDARLDFLTSGPDLYEFKEPLRWEADITNTGGALLVTGTVEGTATGSCSRCLESVDIPVTGEIEGYFLISPEAAAPEDMEGDEFEFLPEDKTIDMAPLIHAALLLEMPRILLCDEECQGLCPSCGANLNTTECGCVSEDEGASPSENPFAVLKNVTFDE